MFKKLRRIAHKGFKICEEKIVDIIDSFEDEGDSYFTKYHDYINNKLEQLELKEVEIKYWREKAMSKDISDSIVNSIVSMIYIILGSIGLHLLPEIIKGLGTQSQDRVFMLVQEYASMVSFISMVISFFIFIILWMISIQKGARLYLVFLISLLLTSYNIKAQSYMINMLLLICGVCTFIIVKNTISYVKTQRAVIRLELIRKRLKELGYKNSDLE